MTSEAFLEGQAAFKNGYSITENPYRDGTQCAWDWDEGFHVAGDYGNFKYNRELECFFESRGT
jgi:hypothetical protein